MSLGHVTALGFSLATIIAIFFMLTTCTQQQDHEASVRNKQNNDAAVILAERGCVEWTSYGGGVRCDRWRSEP